jgi:hypothetical protein
MGGSIYTFPNLRAKYKRILADLYLSPRPLKQYALDRDPGAQVVPGSVAN